MFSYSTRIRMKPYKMRFEITKSTTGIQEATQDSEEQSIIRNREMQALIYSVFFLFAVASADPKPRPHEACSHVFEGRQACTLFPETVEGPYYLDERANRSDITEGLPGVPLVLNLQVLNYTTCQPLPDVVVDIWSSDAMGEYSGFSSNPNDTTSFRGFQITNSNGNVAFQTIFPGWYPGRTIHIHVDAWVNNEKHLGQFYFTELLTQQIARLSPYNQNTVRRTINTEDFIYRQDNGDETTLTLIPNGNGFRASMVLGFER